MSHDELAQAAAEYAAAPESEERYKALWQAIIKLPIPSECCTSGLISCNVSELKPLDFNCSTTELFGAITTYELLSEGER